MYKITLLLAGVLIFFSGNTFEKNSLKFFNSSFRPETANKISKRLINFNDSIPDDSLTIYYTKTDLPVAISRNIHTSVCADTLCRLVDITLYWEITGKFLGYSLPSGEELTKKEHCPFSANDYAKLLEILSDSLSPLRFYTSAEIHPLTKTVAQTDGITGATSANLSCWIVPEAAYTSHTLWNQVYGVTRDSIINYTKVNLLSDKVLINLLEIKDFYNQKFALQWIAEKKRSSNQFLELATEILHNGSYNTVEQALKYLKGNNKDRQQLQKEVIPLLENEDFKIRNMATQFFNESDKITQNIAGILIQKMKTDDYYQVNVILSILEKKVQPDCENILKICSLLENKNGNVANRAYNYLFNLKEKSPELTKEVNRFRRKHGI